MGLEICPLTELVTVECANGQALPYVGCVVVDVSVVKNITKPCMFLVVPDESHSKSVPILLGTNNLEQLLPASNPNDLPSPVSQVARCLQLRRENLYRNNGAVAYLVHNGTSNMDISPADEIAATLSVRRVGDYPSNHVIVEGILGSPLSVDIPPSIIAFEGQKEVIVELRNTSNKAIEIPAGTVVAQLVPVMVASLVSTEQTLPDLSNAQVPPEDHEALSRLVKQYADVFSQHELDLGHYGGVKNRIELLDEHPFKQRYRRIPPHMMEEVSDHLRQLEASGVIRPSKSPFSSPVVCCRKKNGQLRLCIDYRLLNQRTKKDNYCLPRIEDILDSLKGSKHFSRLDLKSGYHQIEIDEEHKERTAFTVGPLGFFEHNRLAFGLCNSPATFQRVMEDCFADVHLKDMYVYIDDIIIFSSSVEEHIEKLQRVFERLRQCGLKLAPQKCDFLQSEISFLGFHISADGIHTDPEKISKVKEWKTPSNAKELSSFLGFAGYYRRFVKGFSRIALPLNHLRNESSKKWQWGQEHENAFSALKVALCQAPVLAYPDFQKPFELHTDASSEGLGAVLCQEQDGLTKVVAYASRGLTKAEQRYPAHKREFLALKWSVVDKFHDYLWGAPKFAVKTDNNPLTYVLTSAKLDATGHRWLAALASFDFSIHYVPGHSNTDADALSRLSFDTIDIASVQATCHMVQTPFASCMNLDGDFDDLGTGLPEISLMDLRREQNSDSVLGVWLSAVRSSRMPKIGPQVSNVKHGVMRRNFSKFFFKRGVLYRRTANTEQLVLPQKRVVQVCEALHDDCGHQGYDKTLALIQERFFWPCMTVDVGDWVENCGRCIRFKTQPHIAPLVGVTTSEPLELVCTDFLKVDAANNGTQYILVVTDHFTRYAKAYPTRNMSAKSTADALLSFIQSFGIPKRLHSDQGANFTGKVVKELCVLLGVEKSRTTPYHPMGNGACERWNQTLIRMLGTLPPEKKPNWPNHIGMLVLAYNSTPHESTGFSPFYLLFGRQPRLPVDILFQRESVPKQVKEMREALEWAWTKAAETDKTKKEKRKLYYDRKVRGATLEPGDRVLVKEVAFDRPHKIQDKWSQEIYEVQSRTQPDMPVYRIRPIDGGRERTLHRNLLFPVQIVRDPALRNQTAPVPKVKTSPPPEKPVVVSDDASEKVGDTASSEVESESDDEEFETTVFVERQSVDIEPPVGIIETPPAPSPPRPEPPVLSPPPPVPAPRASNRQRQPPTWMRSGEYALDAAVNALVALLPCPGIDVSKLTDTIISLVLDKSGRPFLQRGGVCDQV